MGTVITVASGKGGTGKTSFCANVAVALCALGEKVLLIDADAGLRSLDLVLGMTDSLLFSYADVISGAASLKEAAVKHSLVRNLRVLTAPQQLPLQGLDPQRIAALLQRAREHFTFTFIDCPAGISPDILSFGTASDRAVIVSTPDTTSLRSAQSMAQALAQAGQNNSKIAVNRVRRDLMNRGDSANVDRAMDSAGLGLLGVIPEDPDVIACANHGRVLAMYSLGQAQQAYFNIARRLQGQRVRLLNNVKGY